MLVDALDDIFGPGLDVALGTAFEHDQEAVAAEPAAQIGGRQLHAQELRELRHEILAREDADRILDLEEAVGFDVGELAHAALHGVRAARVHGGDQIALLQEARRWRRS